MGLDGFTASDGIVLEIFAGTGGVSACFKRHGFTNSVSRGQNTFCWFFIVSIIPLDLTKLEDQQAVLDWIQHPAVKAVYVVPPCGTASAARNIDIPAKSAKTVEVV